MSEHPESSELDPVEQGASSERGQADGQAQASDAAPADELSRLRAELEETQHRLLRVSADYQNFVRRSQGNIDQARQQQLMDVARALLVVLDHFDHALAVDPQKTNATAMLQGVQIVRDELLATLERFAIRRQAVEVGEEFVPGKHEAVMQQAVQDMAGGKVASVLQAGYELGEVVLRPSKVSVSQ